MLRNTFSIFTTFCILSFFTNDANAIVLGTEVNTTEFSFTVSLRNETGQHYCTGTLITNKHVLTSAQCVYEDDAIFLGEPVKKLSPEVVKVLVGSLSTIEGGDTYEVESLTCHPNYNVTDKTDLLNDIAVITLKRNVTIPNVKILNLPIIALIYPQAGHVGTVVGWGMSSVKTMTRVTTLHKLSVQIIEASCCERAWASISPQTSQIVSAVRTNKVQCAQPVQNGTGLCIGDGGSPLLICNQLVGIAVGAFPCAKGYPDLYSSVLTYKDFIYSVINKS